MDMLEDKDLYFIQHEPDPSNPAEKRIEINYVYVHDVETTDQLDHTQRFIRFDWEGESYMMYRLMKLKKFCYEEDTVYGLFLLYLEGMGYNRSLLESQPTSFSQPKKTCNQLEVMEVSDGSHETDNRYSALEATDPTAAEPFSASALSPLPTETSQQRPPMEFKKKPPPVTIRINDDSVLPVFQNLLQDPSYVRYQNQRITVYPATHEEYKEVMREADNNHLGFFTYNPLVLNIGKCVLKGLPTSTVYN